MRFMRVIGIALNLSAKQKMRRNQNGHQPLLHGRLETIARLTSLAKKAHQSIQLSRCRRAPVGPICHPL